MKLDALIHWYKTLTPETLSAIREIYHEDAHFRDPFNDVHGQQAITAVFRHMFETTDNPVFHITATQRDDPVAWVSWTFSFRLRGKSLLVDGVTRLDFGDDGRVKVHRDYWDATDLFIQLPLLGSLMRYLRNKLAVPLPEAARMKSNR